MMTEPVCKGEIICKIMEQLKSEMEQKNEYERKLITKNF